MGYKKQVDVRKSPTFETIRDLIVEDAVGELPKNITDIVDIDFLAILAPQLIKMRKQGYAYIAYNKDAKTFFTDNVSYDGYRYYLGSNDVLNPKNVITLGDDKDTEKFKFKLSIGNLIDIARYENAIDRIDERDAESTYVYLKSKEYQDAVESGNSKLVSLFKRKFKAIVNRKESHLIAMSPEDELGSNQINISNESIKEIKEKIAFNLRIPYSKLWKGSASGYNNLDLDDRKKWNTKVVYFQALAVLPAIKQYLKIDGREHDIKNIKLEPIENEDKEMLANIASQKIEDITSLYTMGLVNKQNAINAVNNIINLGGKNNGY